MTAQDYTSPSSQRQYRKLFKVGRGGMGDVHLALSTGHGAFRKLVVLKCRRPAPDDENDLRGMFLEEGRLAALLNHPNIVQTYEVGQLDGTDYIAMEFLEGQPVSHLSAQAGGLAPRLVAHIAEQVLRGLHYAQELRDLDGSPLNIIHRDLSPENIFVTYDGAVKVLDFGIAKSDARSREVTEAGVLKGKLSYMAPEQVESFTADRRTDIFVLGMVMWELLTGKRLNSHRSAVDQFRWLTEGKVPSLMTTMNVDPELDAIVQTACQRKPQSRYATAQEMRHALEAYLSRNGGGGAAEHLSRVMVSHFARVRDSMRVQVRQQIQELDQGPEESTPSEERDDSRDLPSVITYVVQNSDLISGDDNYRNATTGRVVLPRRRSWAAWAAASGVAALCLGWFQYARSVGTESIVFRMLPQDAPNVANAGSEGPGFRGAPTASAIALGAAWASPAASVDGEPMSASDALPTSKAAALGTNEVSTSTPEAASMPAADHRTEQVPGGVASSGVSGADRRWPVPLRISGSSASHAASGVASVTGQASAAPTRKRHPGSTWTASETTTHATSPQRELATPQVDDMLPSRVPMVN
jgi:serine/threonine protein kinase